MKSDISQQISYFTKSDIGMKKLNLKNIIFFLMIFSATFTTFLNIYDDFHVSRRKFKFNSKRDELYHKWYFEHNRIIHVKKILNVITDIFLIKKSYSIWISMPASWSYVLVMFSTRYFLKYFPFDYYVKKIVSKRYPDNKVVLIEDQYNLPPKDPIGYIGFYFVTFIYETVLCKITHLIDGRNLKPSNEEDEDEEEEEEEEESSNDQEKNMKKKKKLLKLNDIELPRLDIETGKEIKASARAIMKGDETSDSSDSDSHSKDENHDYICTAHWFWLIHFSIIAIVFFTFTILAPESINSNTKGFDKVIDKELLKATRKMAKTVGFRLNTMYVMTETNFTNAFVMGLINKRVVITEPLTKKMGVKELAAIIGHEIGHWYNMHMFNQVLGRLFPFFVYSIFIQYVAHSNLREFGFGEKTPDVAVIVFIGIVVYDTIFEIWVPVTCVFTRMNERTADCFPSSFNLPIGKALVDLIRKDSYDNNNYDATPLYHWFYATHPNLKQRLENLRHCKKVIWPKVVSNI